MHPAVVRQRRRLRLLASVALFGVIAAACSSGGSGGTDGRASVDAPAPRGPSGDLPAAEIELLGGETVTLAHFVGDKPVVVNFFASWCAPCRAEMPDFQEVYADVQTEVDFLGLAMQDSRGAAEELVDLTGVQYPWALDNDGLVYAEFRGFSMPTTVFISSDGDAVGKINGSVSQGELRAQIEEHFGVST